MEVITMTDFSSYKDNLENYLTSVSILKALQKLDILSVNDFKEAEEKFIEIYCINKSSIYRQLP
jgi:hypothetical protein